MGILVINLPTINQSIRSSSNDEKPLLSDNTHWCSLKTRQEFEEHYAFMPSRIIDNFVKGVPITVVEWNRIQNKPQILKQLIDNAYSRRFKVTYDHSAPLRRLTFGLDMADYLMMYPFPKKYYLKYEKDKSLEEKYQTYREKMIDKCGIVFFMFGNRYDDKGNLVNAPGVRKEFDIAFKKHKYVFPIGATGYMAKELADQVLADFEYYNGKMPNLKRILKKLNSPKIEPKDIIENILNIIDTLAFRPENK